MEIQFLTQPFDSGGSSQTIGDKLTALLASRSPLFNRVWLVSAFVNRKVVVRLATYVAASRDAGAEIHFVVGIDFHSTSVEALREILALNIDAKVMKNPRTGHTFHPKLYLFEATGQRAVLLLGSSNLTDGGIFKNYEVAACLSLDLTGPDAALYQDLQSSLGIFLNPDGPIVQPLTEDLIKVLIQRGDIVSEVGKKQARRQAAAVARRASRTTTIPPSPFGTEFVPSPPPLPDEPVRRVIKVSRQRLHETDPHEPASSYDITEFYMHLNKLQGPTIPGEVRIPVTARRIDRDFWGWPDQYQTEYRMQGRKSREYKSWKPLWRILNVDVPDQVYEDEVRIYGYMDRTEFRFYSRRLVLMGADEFDVLRITRCDPEDEATFQCELARQGSPTHALWEDYCTQPMPNSKRRYGFV